MRLLGKVSESFEGAALLEEVSHWGRALRVCSLLPFPLLYLGFSLGVENVISQLFALAPCCVPPPLVGSLPLEPKAT